MFKLFSVEVTDEISYNCLVDETMGIKEGDIVVVKCERYLDFGEVTGLVQDNIPDAVEYERQKSLSSRGRHIEGNKIPWIQRIATPEDIAKDKDNQVKAETAFEQTKARIRAHNLEMKLLRVHYALDRKLLIFQFSAEGRVDFRELLKDLSTLFRIRVELRQVGVRDEAALLGGLGSCGRPFCCSTFLNTFSSINVKMAKQQGVSMNPQNILGCCGRLKCCLAFEADAYKNVPVGGQKKQQARATGDELDERTLAKMDEIEHRDSSAGSEIEHKRKNGRNRPRKQG